MFWTQQNTTLCTSFIIGMRLYIHYEPLHDTKNNNNKKKIKKSCSIIYSIYYSTVQHKLHYYFVFSCSSNHYGSHDDANPNPIHNKTFPYFSQLKKKTIIYLCAHGDVWNIKGMCGLYFQIIIFNFKQYYMYFYTLFHPHVFS